MTQLLSRIFNPPKISTDDYEYLSRYYLAYKSSVFFCFSFAILEIVLLFAKLYPTAIITTLPLATVIVSVFYIRRTKDFFISGVLLNVIGIMACQAGLWFVNDQPHFAGLLWMVVSILFAFLLMKPIYGLVTAVIHGVSSSLFILFKLNSGDLVENTALTQSQLIAQAINIAVSFTAIAYLIYQYYLSSRIAKVQLNEAQEVLQEQYDIISKQNEEKTVMLKEIHHRVKNNLQIITSLLRLQSRELESPEAIAKFKDATHRVIAMSMIHEKMYQSDELSTMHLREYLSGLTQDLVSSYQSGYDVKININCTVDSVGLRSIVPLALILNELISNSLKYAFDVNDNCAISIEFHPTEGTNCKLLYKDSGTWKEPSRKGSFGMDLIESLTHQLEGSLKTTTYPETSFEFVFSPVED